MALAAPSGVGRLLIITFIGALALARTAKPALTDNIVADTSWRTNSRLAHVSGFTTADCLALAVFIDIGAPVLEANAKPTSRCSRMISHRLKHG